MLGSTLSLSGSSSHAAITKLRGPVKVSPGIWPRLPSPEGPPALLSGSPSLGCFLLLAGSTVYTCMLNHRGGAESDLTVSRLAPGPEGLPLAPGL